jgi:hypothetical protein
VVNCSIVVTIRSMWDWLVYAALIAGALGVIGAIVLLAVRVLQALRAFKRLRRHVFRGLDRVAEQAEATLDKLGAVSDTEKLDGSLARLRESLAQLAVLRAAWDDATAFTSLIPRK